MRQRGQARRQSKGEMWTKWRRVRWGTILRGKPCAIQRTRAVCCCDKDGCNAAFSTAKQNLAGGYIEIRRTEIGFGEP